MKSNLVNINDSIQIGLSVLKEQPPMSLSEWADKFFYLSPESSGIEGQWETLPFQKGIMDIISNDDIHTLSWQKCARIGYTKIIMAACAYFASNKKRNQVIYQPTDADAARFVKNEIDPMLRDVTEVSDIFRGEYGKKSKYNTTTNKSFIGSELDILGGKSPRNYRALTKDVAFYDELSGFDLIIGDEGTPDGLGDTRLTQSPFPKSIRGSTPKISGMCHIERCVSESDIILQYHLKCPKCKKLTPLKWGFFDSDEEGVYCECPNCQEPWEYKQLYDLYKGARWQSEDGIWLNEKEKLLFDKKKKTVPWPRHVGITGLWAGYSPFITWSDLWEEHQKAKRIMKQGSKGPMITFVNTRLAETWEDEGEKVDAAPLLSRREHYPAAVPDGVKEITSWTDVQGDRLETEVVGWGAGEESWSLEYIRLYGDVSKPQVWDILAEMLRKQYKNRDNEVFDIRLHGIDRGYLPDSVKEFCHKHGRNKFIPTLGRDGWERPIAQFPRKPDKDGLYTTIVGADNAKELIYNRLIVDEFGAGYCHFPRQIGDEVIYDYDQAYFAQLVAEEKRKRYTRGKLSYFFDAKGRRNEALDCRVGNLAMIRIAQQFMGVNLSRSRIEKEQAPEPKKSAISNNWIKGRRG